MYKGGLFKGALFAGLLFGSVIAIELPPTIPIVSAQKPSRGHQLSLKAFHKLGSTTYDAEIGRLLASHASAGVITGESFTANFGKLGVSAASRVALIPVDSAIEFGQLTAEGRHDISDDELAALIMEILDA